MNIDSSSVLALAFAAGSAITALAGYGFGLTIGRGRLSRPSDAPDSEWSVAVQDRVAARMSDFEREARFAVVDPWAMQAELMGASGQDMPERPAVTDNSVLYAALVLEEGAETAAALAEALRSVGAMAQVGEGESVTAEQDISSALVRAVTVMGRESRYIRGILAGKPGINFPLTSAEAAEILDGTTDVAVVNSGFALASGLPGAAAYVEVQESNLSKRNQETGVIDKDPSGKWIKGDGYFAPDLVRVLREAGGL